MPTRNINLTSHFDKFIEDQVVSGQYGNASEIVRDALRLLEVHQKEQAAKLSALRRAGREGFRGIDQGNGVVLKSAADVDRFVDEIASKVTKSSKGKARA